MIFQRRLELKYLLHHYFYIYHILRFETYSIHIVDYLQKSKNQKSFLYFLFFAEPKKHQRNSYLNISAE